MASTSAPALITKPLPDLASWVRHFRAAELPVLRATARRMAELNEADTAGPRDLADVVLGDPLATTRLFARLAIRRADGDATTVEGLVMLKGLDRTFALVSDAPTVEQVLAPHPRALVGFLRVANRARRAADFARTIAAWRQDVAVEEIGIAALLHDIGELLMWALAPTLALDLAELRAKAPTARSRDLQRRLLGIDLHDLQLALVREWRLPMLLVALMDDEHADTPRIHNVLHAVDLARHAANGWDDPALPDDYKAVAELLHSDVAFAERVIRGHADGSTAMPDRSRTPV